MIEHVWSVLCLHGIVDKDSNNISLIGILEEMHLTKKPSSPKKQKAPTKGKPVLPVDIEWVTLWERTQDDSVSLGHIKGILVDPSGKIIGQDEHDVDLSKCKRLRHISKISSLPILESGRYQFRTQIKDEKTNRWKSVSSLPLQVFVKT